MVVFTIIRIYGLCNCDWRPVLAVVPLGLLALAVEFVRRFLDLTSTRVFDVCFVLDPPPEIFGTGRTWNRLHTNRKRVCWSTSYSEQSVRSLLRAFHNMTATHLRKCSCKFLLTRFECTHLSSAPKWAYALPLQPFWWSSSSSASPGEKLTASTKSQNC